jgi:hypothetical protein
VLDKSARTYIAVVFAFGLAISLPISWAISQLHPALSSQKEESVNASERGTSREGNQPPQPESFGERLTSDPVAFFTMALAFITGGLAVYTALLWRSTSKLVSGAEQTAQRQLRAYVHPDSISIYDGSSLSPPRMDKINVPGVVMTWRNTGESPAKDVVIWSKMAVFAIRSEAKIRPPASLQKQFPNTLGRGIPGNRSLWYKRALTAAQCEDIASGRLGIYFYGRIEYRDIFNKRRWTNFKFVYTNSAYPPVGNGGGVFNICQSGNTADDEEE